MSDDKHYLNLSNERIDKGFNEIDIAMGKVVNEHKLNIFEVLTVLEMMATKVRQNNIDQYLLETVTRFQELLNREDEHGR
jgi:hypothetical protein